MMRTTGPGPASARTASSKVLVLHGRRGGLTTFTGPGAPFRPDRTPADGAGATVDHVAPAKARRPAGFGFLPWYRVCRPGEEFSVAVLIVGAGIGGLVTALSLHQHGIDCEVHEQANDVRELGVGVNALPHAVRVLARLGLLDRLDEIAIRTQELLYTTRTGQLILREPRGTGAGFDVPQFSVHRGRLQGLLYRAVIERMGRARVHTGHRLVGFEQDGHGVTARFADRAGRPVGSARGDVLVGADGIHSAVRAAFHPGEGPPRWNGAIMWRGAADWPRFLSGGSMIIAGGAAAKLVVYPIADGAAPGTRLTNWAIGVATDAAGAVPPRPEDWSRPGDPDELAEHVGLFSSPHVDVRGLVAATPECYEFPMCDRDPLPAWSHGRVTLLGDAAHPMLPMGSNGLGQAVLDAGCLSELLARHSDPVRALAAYQEDRLPRTAEIVRLNRIGGPERVIDEVERRAPDGFERVEDVISVGELEAIVRRYASVAGFAPELVNRSRR
jgi:5-methylphenazine-1-carboxylate 1-monooxygenase